jgi:hypothetical protein
MLYCLLKRPNSLSMAKASVSLNDIPIFPSLPGVKKVNWAILRLYISATNNDSTSYPLIGASGIIRWIC